MKPCEHDLKMIVGMADGYHCKGCGQIFKEIPKQIINEEPAKAPEPKAPAAKAPAKKSTKGGKK